MSPRAPRALLQVVTSTDRRGAELSAVALAPVLELRGWDVRTLALAPGASTTPLDLPTLGTRSLGVATLRALRHEVRQTGVVIAHGSRTLPACALATRGTGVPFVYRNIGDPRYWASSRSRRFRAGMAMRRAATVVALSSRAVEPLVQHYGLDPSTIEVIPPAVDRAHHQPAAPGVRAAARSALGIPLDAPVVGVVGSLSDEKDPALALAAVAALPDAHLVVAGTGPLEHDLARDADRMLAGRAHLLGALADPSPCYDAADVVVMTSRSEGLPAVLIEAGMRGLPVVTTDVGLVADIVVDGETGFVTTSRAPDAVARALGSALEQRDRLGAAARTRCERFDLDAVAARWDTMLRSLLPSRDVG